MTSRKIPREYDNPIDNVLIDVSEWLNPYFKSLNFTPNMITTLSLLFGIVLNIAYYYNYYYLAGFSLIISYFFDCMDGNYARKYNMQSKIGDIYDHVKDWLVLLIFLILFLTKGTTLKFKLISVIIVVIIVIGSSIHLGCTEKYIRKNKNKTKIKNSDTLALVSWCPDMKYLSKTRYLSTGTLNLFIALIIIAHKYV